VAAVGDLGRAGAVVARRSAERIEAPDPARATGPVAGMGHVVVRRSELRAAVRTVGAGRLGGTRHAYAVLPFATVGAVGAVLAVPPVLAVANVGHAVRRGELDAARGAVGAC